jgi:hypothetical protein
MVGRVTPNSSAICRTVYFRLPRSSFSSYICQASLTCRGAEFGFLPAGTQRRRRGCKNIRPTAVAVSMPWSSTTRSTLLASRCLASSIRCSSERPELVAGSVGRQQVVQFGAAGELAGRLVYEHLAHPAPVRASCWASGLLSGEAGPAAAFAAAGSGGQAVAGVGDDELGKIRHRPRAWILPGRGRWRRPHRHLPGHLQPEPGRLR